MFGSFDLFERLTSTPVHDAIQQALRDEAANIMDDARRRQPYISEEDCRQYVEDPVTGIRMHFVPRFNQTINMRKNAAGVWEPKRGKKTD